jgi:phosphohistidine phosphatase
MDLILWRHAHAEELRIEQSDPDRVLTGKGRKQADLMAHWLKQRLPSTTRIVSSPAVRARQTADALCLPYEVAHAIHPDASIEELIKVSQWPDATYPVLLIGHQPTLGRLAARLLSGQEQPWSFKKGGIWWLCSRENQILLKVVLSPDML